MERGLESGLSTESILLLSITLTSIVVLITCLLCWYCYMYVINRKGQECYEENNHQRPDLRPGNVLTLIQFDRTRVTRIIL